MFTQFRGTTLWPFAAIALGLASGAAADTIHVPEDYPTIQEGIDAAQDGDSVVVADGVYTGSGNRGIEFHGKAITLRSENGSGNCIIDAEYTACAFYFLSAETAASVVSGFTITHGGAYNGPGGGGFYCSGGSPTIVNCLITENRAFGDFGSGRGGAVYSYNGSNPTIRDCTIVNNQAYDSGGGLHLRGGAPRLINCVIAGNRSHYEEGGGAYCYYSDAEISNCAIIDNTTFRRGGGLALYWSAPTITGCTISRNSATNGMGNMGGGIYSHFGNFAVIANCILWGNSAMLGEEMYAYAGSPTVRYSDVRGGWSGVGNISDDPLFVDPDGPDDDPETWEDNDYHLSAGSPCIDTGCNWAVPPDIADLDEDEDTSEYTPFDLDGEGRFFDDPDTDDVGCGCPPIVDMGAYEFGDAGPQPCPGDLDCDRHVGQPDLGILLAAWETSDEGDLNCDGMTDQTDLGILLAHWGEGCP